MIKTSLWITFLCGLPYVIYYGARAYSQDHSYPNISWVLILALAMLLAWTTMYYVLFKATTLPKKST